MAQSKLKVAVGVLFKSSGEVLVGQRTVKDRYFQQWEFPGGKLEPGEQPEQALVRELSEELGIEVQAWRPLLELEHEYPDRHVQLMVFCVTQFTGEPHGREDQALMWVRPEELDQIDFLSGNQKIIEAVQNLPE